MKGKIQVILVLLLFAGGLTAVGIATWANRVEKIDTVLVKEVKSEKTPVETQTVATRSLTERLTATGVLTAEQDVTLTAEVSGRVKKMTKSLGDRCKKGELIVKLDPESYLLAVQQSQAALAQAEVNLEYAAREWERMKKLKESDVVPKGRIDSAEGAYDADKAAVAAAKTTVAVAARNLKETNVKCPFDGFIAERTVDPGKSVTPGMPLARLVDTARLTLTLSVTSDKLARLRLGQKAVLSDPALPEQTYAGEVFRLGVAADPATRTFPVELALADKIKGLHTGQVVEASLALQTFDDVIAVPVSAVKKTVSDPHVLVVEGGKAISRTVTLGLEIEDVVIVKTGLKPGDEVIVIGGAEIQDGTAVEVTRRISAPTSAAQKTELSSAEPESK